MLTSRTGAGAGSLNLPGSISAANPLPFYGSLTINDSATNSSTISGGTFVFGTSSVILTGGTVNIVGGNQVDFLMTPANSSPGVTISFNFAPVAGLGTGINQSQIDLLRDLTTNSFLLIDGNPLPLFQGSITAVPEPGSMLALAGLVGGFGGWHYRRRKLAKKA